MKLPFADPDPAGSERARTAKAVRDLATEVSRLTPQALTRTNNEEADHGPTYPANFTKGLLHDNNGLLANAEDYRCFVEAINSSDRTLFEKQVTTAADRFEQTETRSKTKKAETAPTGFLCKPRIDKPSKSNKTKKKTAKKTESRDESAFDWRGWESPRAGHVYELEGPDAGAVGMAPAPRLGSDELAAEMAEVYGLALLRDVPFTLIDEGGDSRLCPSGMCSEKSQLSAEQVIAELNTMRFFSGAGGVVSSTPLQADAAGFNRFERNRRFARNQSPTAPLETTTAFRGSTPGALVGPYVSQFLLLGSQSLAGPGGGRSSFPDLKATFDLQDGFIPYGTLVIDQRTLSHKNCLDYMTDWCSWLDVQNGASVSGIDQYEPTRRFITTPRDLATYVHFDQLYEAYLNAGLLMLTMGVPSSKGFPEPSPSGGRTPFATFGGPHVLSLVTEVATRCLKAVRRQKFNYHRRARPEAIGGRLTLAKLGLGKEFGPAEDAIQSTLDELPDALIAAIIAHNAEQNSKSVANTRRLDCDTNVAEKLRPTGFASGNLLLPMAFPEGSPMHPAYGAGHATVAGGCVTMLKAFFEMFEDGDSHAERELLTADGKPVVYVPNADGTRLVKDRTTSGSLKIQGELDKLAANISIGRNMAGVHYYSDYYDSLRLGERIAVGILLQQAPTYDEYVETTFTSFDGDHVTISGEGGSCPSLSILDRRGNPVSSDAWWLRHVAGGEFSEDL